MRIAALWFPDWPVQAAKLERDGERPGTDTTPVIIAHQHHVKVCSSAARAAGIRRGMRVRAAQAIAPEATVIEDNPDRDGRTFACLAASLDEVAASVEVLRPGLVIADLQAAANFHGGEDIALEMLLDAASRRGIDTFIGAADEIATAVIAARTGTLVPAQRSAQFLATQPLRVLSAETALRADITTVKTLGQLGITTLGECARLPPAAIATRFGAAGMHIYRIAAAAPDRRVAPELAPADLSVTITPEEPIERVDTAAFTARKLAARLHERLKTTGKNCLRLKIVAEVDADSTTAQRVERVWHTREALTEAGIADRVRWQLDGWLTAGGAGVITSLRLEPLELAEPDAVGQLWADGASDQHARRVIERVQSQLGIDAVVQPRFVGGRGVAERIQLIAFGEAASPVEEKLWPGAIPAPLPARLGGGIDHPASSIMLLDATGHPIQVTAEALLSSEPYALVWGDKKYLVTGWAGPWPVDEGWWESAAHQRRVARLQLVGNAQVEGAVSGWLLVWSRRRWRVEAVY